MIKSIDLTGNLMDDLYTLLNVYKLEGATVVENENGTKSEPQNVRVSEGAIAPAQKEDSPIPAKQMAETLKDRFPKNLTPNPKQLGEIWAKVNGDWDVFEDLVLIAEEMSSTQKINSIGGYLLYQLQQDDGSFASIRANGERIRNNKATDTTSVVASAMREAEKKIQKLPARKGPNTAGANRLKSLKIGGAENLERAEGSAATT